MAAGHTPSSSNCTSTTNFLTPADSRIGCGDYRNSVRCKPPTIKKFCNGHKIPVFEESTDETDSCKTVAPPLPSKPPHVWDGNFPALSSQDTTELMDMFRCPICQDYLIEATAASCGHTFCCECLSTWTKQKPICPLCSKRVSCRIRLYTQDLIVEKMIQKCEDFPEEIARSLYEASKTRMDREEATRSEWCRGIKDSLDEVGNTLRCKGVWGMVANCGVVRGLKRRWMEMRERRTCQQEISDDPNNAETPLPHSSAWGMLFYLLLGVAIGIPLGVAWVKRETGVSFFHYLYICIMRYDGSIPDFDLLKREQQSTVQNVHGGHDSWWWKTFY